MRRGLVAGIVGIAFLAGCGGSGSTTVDEAAFREEALQRFGIGAPEADGSKMDAVEAAKGICGADTENMLRNLGADFKGSFQELAMSNYCPDKMP